MASETGAGDRSGGLAELRARLEAIPGIAMAVVFGSRARGDAGPRSDADIGLRLQEGVRRAEVEADVARAAKGKADIVDLDHAPPFLRFEIARDGVLLVERQPHAWCDFKAMAMRDWWDWGPTERRILAAAVRRVRESSTVG